MIQGKDRSMRQAAVPFAAIAVLTLFAACATGEKTPATYALEGKAMAAPAYMPSMPSGAYSIAPPNPSPPYSPFPNGEYNTEEYDKITDNPFKSVMENPVSTFSIDVDTASYSNLRRYLNDRMTPPKDSVRIEELVNYFTYRYPAVAGEHPVEARLYMSDAPWSPGHLLLRVALKARDVDTASLPPSNLVFLVDTSGSMQDENKLPLLKEGLKILARNLRPQDRVSIVAYAGSAGLVLDSMKGDRTEAIVTALSKLEAGGSTAGGEGLALAYDVAKRNFISGGNNRVILCTDGDFNVGVSSTSELERFIETKRKDSIYLTVLGFGTGNYKDSRMETLADKGNGNYAYIDNLLEAKKVLGKEIWGNLYAVAKDVKIQIEFNPAKVREYRLIGYENRLLAREDFNDDTKDAGEMGSGQTVTAFYELVPAQAPPSASQTAPSEPLVFQQSNVLPSDDLLALRLRYKLPEGPDESRMVQAIVGAADIYKPLEAVDEDFRFATAVVEFGMLLRDSEYKGSSSWKDVMQRAKSSKGEDSEGYRAEFVRLAEIAELLQSP